MKPDKSHGQDSLGLAEAQVADLEGALESLYCRAGKALLENAEEAARQADTLTDQLVIAK